MYAARIVDDPDLELVRAARNGERDALDRLLRAHYDRVFALCRRLAGNDADAADASQEAMIAIVRGLDRFEGNSRFSTWAYRVATNACLDELRRRKRRPEPGLPDHETEDQALHDVLGDQWGGWSDATAAEHLDVSAALLRLPVDFRAAVVLRDLCGFDYAEIAEVLGIPSGTVRSRIARGRAALAPLLGNPAVSDERPSPRP